MVSFAPFHQYSPWTIRSAGPKQSPSPPLRFRVSCSEEHKFVLHKALDSAGIDTKNAREGRKGFMAQIENLTAIERGTSITMNRKVDLWKTALYIAAEDDSIVSQSENAFPVDYFVDLLFDVSMNFCTENSSSLTGEKLLDSLEKYLFVSKGLRRSSGGNQIDPPALYLHSVLMEGSGSVAMLALIYSEILKVLRMWSFLDFDCDVFFPRDRHSFPRGYHKQKMKDSDQLYIITTEALLQEMLTNIKETFWPFKHDCSKSSFLRAIDAVNCINRLASSEESFQLASSTAFGDQQNFGASNSGDMRLALSACERLILLESDPKELRDYSILLYHCGFYDQALQYLTLYKEKEQIFSQQRQKSCNKLSNLEEDAVDKLMARLVFISMEKSWS